MIEPRIGLRFVHRRILDENNRPAVYEVTAIQQGVIYIRMDGERKAKEWVTLDRWNVVCGEVLER